MKVLADPTWGVANKEFYVDIDKKLTNRWCKLFAELNRLVVRTNKIESSKANWAISSALGEFLNLVFHYHGFLQEILCRNVDLFRSIGDDEDVVGFANTAENHPLFNPRQLDQWLNFKSAELEMFHSMVCRIGMGIQLICGLFKLGEQPMMPRKKYSLVLYVPPLDDFTPAALKAMQKFAYDPYRYFSLKKESSRSPSGRRSSGPSRIPIISSKPLGTADSPAPRQHVNIRPYHLNANTVRYK